MQAIRRHPRRAAGIAAALVLLGLFVVGKLVIAPLTDTCFLPQSAWSYTAEELQNFGTALATSGHGPLYRNLLRVDLLFMLLWGVWVVRAFPNRRALGLAVAGSVLAFDVIENVVLQQQLDWAMGRSLGVGWVLYPPLIEGATPLPFTRVKLVLYPLVTGALLWRDWRAWRAGRAAGTETRG